MKPNDIQPSKADFEKPPEGHHIKMTCGHRGIPCRGEEKRISRLLRKSGFIPMLVQEDGRKSPSNIKD